MIVKDRKSCEIIEITSKLSIIVKKKKEEKDFSYYFSIQFENVKARNKWKKKVEKRSKQILTSVPIGQWFIVNFAKSKL